MNSNQSLTPWSENKATSDQVIDLLASLSALPSRSFRTEEGFLKAQQAYIDVLEGIDVGILADVCQRFLRGEFITDGDSVQFFPSPAEIMFRCKKFIQRMADDRARDRLRTQSLRDGLSNPPLSPDAKERMSALWASTKAKNAAADPEKTYDTPEAAKDRLEALAAANGKEVDWDKMKDVPTVDGFKRLGRPFK